MCLNYGNSGLSSSYAPNKPTRPICGDVPRDGVLHGDVLHGDVLHGDVLHDGVPRGGVLLVKLPVHIFQDLFPVLCGSQIFGVKIQEGTNLV